MKSNVQEEEKYSVLIEFYCPIKYLLNYQQLYSVFR